MRYVLFTARGPQRGRIIPIRPKVFVIGSSRRSQLRSAEEGIGRRQCVLVIRKKKLFIKDMESGYPTLVNGHMIPAGEREKLIPGDHLGVGPLEFVIKLQRKRRRALLSLPHLPPPAEAATPTQSAAAPAKSTRALLTTSAATAAAEADSDREVDQSEETPRGKRAVLVSLFALVLVGGAVVGYSLSNDNRDPDDGPSAPPKTVKDAAAPGRGANPPVVPRTERAADQQPDLGPPTPFPTFPDPTAPTSPPGEQKPEGHK